MDRCYFLAKISNQKGMIRMRDKNQNYIQFSEQIESFLVKKTYTIEVLRRAVIDSPTFLRDYTVSIKGNKLISLRGLAVISYYVPETLGWKIREILEEKSKKLNFKDQLRLQCLLISKESCLVYLFETQEFSSHEIFGNLLREGLQELQRLKIYIPRYQLVKAQRKRGYDDKGSLRPSDRWLPSHDYSLTALQNEIEKKHNLHNRIKIYLESYLLEKVTFYLNGDNVEK